MTDPYAGSTTEQMKQQAREQTHAARQKGREAAGQVRGRLSEQIDQRATRAGEQVRSTANDVRSVAEELRRQGKDTPARLAEQVADRVESLGSYLRDADGERMLGDVERYARRQPWAVAAGGVVLGFVASRFLKASSSRRYESSVATDRFRSPAGDGGDTVDMPAVVDRYPDRGAATVPPATSPERATETGSPLDDRYTTNRYPEG